MSLVAESESLRALPARALAGGLHAPSRSEATTLANHLTPEELSKELGIDRDTVIRVCIEESIPIYQGKTRPFSRRTSRRDGHRLHTGRVEAGSAKGAGRGALLARGGLLRRDLLAPLGLGDALLERLHQVDHRRRGRLLRGDDLLAGELRLQHRLERAAVLVLEILRLELADQAGDSWRAISSSASCTSVSATASSISSRARMSSA